MTEPKAKAQQVVPVVPGVFRWWVEDDRLDGAESDAYAIVNDGRVVLIDPLPLDEKVLCDLGKAEAIVLTASCHQRSAWRYRRLLGGVPVWAPDGAVGLEDTPDFRYSAGDSLPGELVAFHTPGPTDAMYALWRNEPNTLFLTDLLSHDGSGLPVFMPSEYQDEPWRTRQSVRWLLEHVPVEVLCFNHGPPILSGGREALERALEHDVHPPAPSAPA